MDGSSSAAATGCIRKLLIGPQRVPARDYPPPPPVPCSTSDCLCTCARVLLRSSSDRSFGISAVLTFADKRPCETFISLWAHRECLEKGRLFKKTQQKQTWNVISRTSTIALKKRTARMATLLPRGRAAAELGVN